MNVPVGIRYYGKNHPKAEDPRDTAARYDRSPPESRMALDE